jgi:NSS family neurotransmitter:Na+ symporter
MNDSPGNHRETWNTRSAFVLAAIGSAVGLGNLWGFPYKVYSYGGGAFLVPYFIAMIIMGIPLLIMEFSVGHWAQMGPPDAFQKVSRKYRFVGWWLVTLAFVIITYYTIILGYCVIFLSDSIQGLWGTPLPWAGEGVAGASDYFFKDTLAYEDGYALTGLQTPVVVGMLISWGLIYLCLFKGVKLVSKVVLFTVPLPWIMLLILTFRGLTLDGAMTGLHFYLEPDWTKLADADTWRFAFGQVFFSMSLGFAVMLSYASFLHRRSDLNNNALIIGLGDLGTSFIAGIAVFATLGAMALQDNSPVETVVKGGPSLAFVTFPYALSKLPAGQAVFSMVFFVALLTLGIDSAFSIVEACLTSVCDSKPKWPRKYVLPGICVAGAAVGIVYCGTGGGLNILDLADSLINGPMGILVVALAESIVIGWAWKGKLLRKIRDHANERSDWQLHGWWDIIVKYVSPLFLVSLIAWSISDFVYEQKFKLLIGSGVFLLIPILFRFVISGRSRKKPDEPEESDALTTALLIGLPGSAILVGVAIGLARLLTKSAPAVVAEVADVPAVFVAKELGVTSYAVLGIALTVIFGGLVWCFWKAILAAGRLDPEMEEIEEKG